MHCSPPEKEEKTGSPTAPIKIYTATAGNEMLLLTEQETTYIAKVESEIGIAPAGTESGAKTQIIAATMPMSAIFLVFKGIPRVKNL